MIINDIQAWLTSGASLLALIKEIVPLLPKGPNKDEAENLLAQAERDQKHAEASLATGLGFPLCPRCWPPQIILLGDNDKPVCRACGKPSPPRVLVA